MGGGGGGGGEIQLLQSTPKCKWVCSVKVGSPPPPPRHPGGIEEKPRFGSSYHFSFIDAGEVFRLWENGERGITKGASAKMWRWPFCNECGKQESFRTKQ